MSGAVDYLAAHPNVTGEALGAMGFCMGGLLSFYLAANRPDRIAAVVPFYGFPLGDDEPDYSAITAPIPDPAPVITTTRPDIRSRSGSDRPARGPAPRRR